ncbi:MAG: glycine cleavage system protein GcvH [Nitrososphaeraceae archaeon]
MSDTELRFSREHEWIKLIKEEDTIMAVIGISDFAQEQLSDIVSVELPRRGTKAKQMQAIAIVDSVKTSSDIYSPLTGEIVEINEELLDHPEWINQSPYELGWIVKINPDNLPQEIQNLMTQKEYEEFIGNTGNQ